MIMAEHKIKIIVLGMMSRHKVAGMVWLTIQFVIGLKRLGYEVYYVEAHGAPPNFPSESEEDGHVKAAAFVSQVMKRFDLGTQWAYLVPHSERWCYGMSECQLKKLLRSADLILNLHGGTIPNSEYMAVEQMVYLGTDPVNREIDLFHNVQETIDLLAAHRAHFTWAENYGNPDCRLPVAKRFNFHPTRQPIVLDFWQNHQFTPSEFFTTIGSWRQMKREVEFQGEVYHWSKHFEILKFIDLPGKTAQSFELALSGCPAEDEALLTRKGWLVRDALAFSLDLDAYTQYIAESRAEFTVAKDQNVRLRTGWFSDRSACYLATGRPVITQETGFSNILPTGEGLFAFNTMDDILQAVDAINADYERHSLAAREIARAYFSHDTVLPRLLQDAGI